MQSCRSLLSIPQEALALAIMQVGEVKPTGADSPLHNTVTPAGQAPGELKGDTCRAGLHPPAELGVKWRLAWGSEDVRVTFSSFSLLQGVAVEKDRKSD